MTKKYKVYDGKMDVGYTGDGWVVDCDYVDVPIPVDFLGDAFVKIVIGKLIYVLETFESEILEVDGEESPDDFYAYYHIALQFGLSILTIDSGFLDDKTKKYLKNKFSFDEWAYKAYMRDVFFRSNSPYFDKVYRDDVEWEEDFDVEKEKSKPFLLYQDWLQEKNDDGKTNYERFIK
jgi:hypothetical protein